MSDDNPLPGSLAAASVGTQRQMEIYLAGLEGRKPAFPVAIEELEQKAKAALTPEAYAYVAGSAGSEDSACANVLGFKRWHIVPRFLRDVSKRELSVDVLGQRFVAPVVL